MSELERPSEEKGEKEHSKKAIWLIDDNKKLAQSLMFYAQSYKPADYDFIYYQEAEEAINDFSRFVEMRGQLPAIILLDYTLDESVENPRFRTGLEVIESLKKICEEAQIIMPEIIAFSASDFSNRQLIEAGANSVVNKGKFQEIKSFFQNL